MDEAMLAELDDAIEHLAAAAAALRDLRRAVEEQAQT